jgi:predicted lipoprotein with Yx(FWY)xxD motif
MFYQQFFCRTAMRSMLTWGFLALFILIMAGCAPITPPKAATSTNAQPTKAAEPTKAASSALTTTISSKVTETAIVMVAENAKLGKILVDAKGMTLYLFDKDAKDKSNCSGDCLKNWPALTVKDEKEAMAGKEVAGKLGTITRDDGTYQITVNGMPVYYYAKDKAAGDVVGQGVGDVWWVLGPDGNKITKK